MAYGPAQSPLKNHPRTSLHSREGANRAAMLTPRHAWRILRRRTGGIISRTTFYRWLDSGKLFSIHLGHRLYIPWPAFEELVQACRSGQKF